MKHLIIIGAGGMGRCIHDLAKDCVGYGIEYDIKGFIDDNINALCNFKNYPPVLSTINNYEIVKGDEFVCSIGNTRIKRSVCEQMKSKGAHFRSLIHKTAIVGTNTVIGSGSVVAEYAMVSNDVVIGENSLVQCFSVVGHDCRIGNYVRIDTHCTCVGGIILCDGVIMHTSSIINHNVIVGENATVGAGSFVIRKVKPGSTVWGNPAKLLDY